MTRKEEKAAARATYLREWSHVLIHRTPPKRKHPSSTPGKDKVGCKASSLDKFMATASRSYRHPDYRAWCASHTGRKRYH